MASSSIGNLSIAMLPACKSSKSHHRSSQVKAQIYRDHEGKSRNNMVDSNILVLKERIELIKNKEKLERCCVEDEAGWNYAPLEYSLKHKKDEQNLQFFRAICMIGGTFGFTVFGCSSCLFIVSVLIHSN